MEESQQNPQQPSAPQNGPEPKKFPKKVLLIIIIGLALIGGALAYAMSQDNAAKNTRTAASEPATTDKPTERKAVEQVFVSPVDGTKTSINTGGYYGVSVGSTQYYGTLTKINDSYIRLSPTLYVKGNNLAFFSSNELHGPEPITYFHVARVAKVQQLDATLKENIAIINAIKSSPSQAVDAYPAAVIDQYLKQGQFKAFFFNDGQVFFARVDSLKGNFLTGNVYYLEGQDGSPTASTQQISLALAKPAQYSSRTSSELQYWQNMKNDSQITKAALQFEADR